MHRAAVAAVVAVAAALSACQATTLQAVPQNQAPSRIPAPPTAPAPDPDRPPSGPTRDATPPPPLGGGCSGSTEPVLASSRIEPALGHRHLVLGVTNCTEQPLVLDGAPSLVVRDGTGGLLDPTATSDPFSPPTPYTLAPDASAYLQLHWLAAATPSSPDAGHELVVIAPTQPPVTLTLRDQLDLDDASTIEVHDWAPTVAEAVQQ
ncbi:DUF4232 domain-containing protein [Desertihabitans brevis]|uniref:DUF4232 domain-containing protein n=1 Tax=Desertihabitans brevis TaxID=2268447 RepID=UPI0011BD68DE|nr:DUF4232 domain-containing protein [Desertihabitans brevis]